MHNLEIARFLGHQLVDRILPVFNRGVARIPESELGFRPTSENMTAKELAYHVPQVTFLLTRALKTGRMSAEDLNRLTSTPEEAQTPDDLLAYAEETYHQVHRVIESLSEADMHRVIDSGPRDTSLELLMLAVEEAIHHRGQLSTYLRLMGVVPPKLHEHS